MSRFNLELTTVSICSKIFELIIFNPIFEYLEKVLSSLSNKFGFRQINLAR